MIYTPQIVRADVVRNVVVSGVVKFDAHLDVRVANVVGDGILMGVFEINAAVVI